MIRFAVKVGVAAGAVYYLNQEGIWKESQESLKTYEKLNTTLQPYVAEIKKQIPVELPEIPISNQSSQTLGSYWNKGVMSTFEFLSELPGIVSGWTQGRVNAILESPDVKMFFESSPESDTAKK